MSLFSKKSDSISDELLTEEYLMWESFKLAQKEEIKRMGNRYLPESRLQLIARYFALNRGDGKSPLLGDTKQCDKARQFLVERGMFQ